MARPRGFPSRIQTRSRRQTSWSIGPDASLNFSSTGKQGWTSGVQLVNEDQVTLVRIRGSLLFFLTAATAIGDGFHGAVGLALVTNQAFAIGATAIPGPLADPDFGWIWHSFFDARAVTALEADGANAVSSVLRIDIDSKAMRKWNESSTLVGMVEVTEGGTATAEMFAEVRLLAKLS